MDRHAPYTRDIFLIFTCSASLYLYFSNNVEIGCIAPKLGRMVGTAEVVVVAVVVVVVVEGIGFTVMQTEHVV